MGLFIMLCYIVAVKRLMREAQELSNPTEQYFAQPLEVCVFIYL